MLRSGGMGKSGRNLAWFAAALSLALFFSGAGFAETLFVNQAASGAGDGTSWGDAYISLALALEDVVSGDVVWVAEGTYSPEFEGDGGVPADGRDATFAMKSGVKLYGGFPAEASPDFGERDPELYVTVLTGDLKSDDVVSGDVVLSNDENSYNVVVAVGVDESALLDGFSITGGNADTSAYDSSTFGGGIYSENSSFSIENCVIRGNRARYGGGMYCLSSSLTLRGCTFDGNHAFWGEGGGMYNSGGSSPDVRNCSFAGNRGMNGGGGIYNSYSNPTLSNCLFSENRGGSGYGGGGVSNRGSSPEVSHCAFISNTAGTGNGSGNGGGMCNGSGSSPEVSHCAFTNNRAYRQGGGMYNSASSSPVLSNCTFDENWSQQSGGGMSSQMKCDPLLTNCTFSGNSSGLFNSEDSSPVLTNCTFSGNGSGMFNWNSSPRSVNCIFLDEGDEIRNLGTSAPVMSHCVVKGDDVGEGTVSEDIFAAGRGVGPLGDHGSSITCGVPGQEFVLKTCAVRTGCGAIDNGLSQVLSGDVNLVLPSDQRGVVRPEDAGVDIGAYETNRWFTITVSAGSGGAVAADPYDVIASSDQIESRDFTAYDTPTFVVMPDEHYHIASVVVDGTVRDEAAGQKLYAYPFPELLENHSITALFAPDVHSLTVNPEGAGAGEVVLNPGGGSYPYGTDVTITAVPGEDSTFAGWTGVDTSSGTSATVNIDGDRIVSAAFELKSFTVTATAGTGGSVSPTSAVLNWGDGHVVTVTPDEGFVIADVVVDGMSRGPLSIYHFENVTSDHALQVHFAPDAGMLHDGGVEDLTFPDGGGGMDALNSGTASLDLPGSLTGGDFVGVSSSDVEGLIFSPVVPRDLGDVIPDLCGSFLGGTSFDIAAEGTLSLDGIGVLPLDLVLRIPESDLSLACLEMIEDAEAELGLPAAFLGEVKILKVTEGGVYDLLEIVLDAGIEPGDFISVSRDGAGDFGVGIKLLIADAPACGVPAVQAVTASGDCRFLVFDGTTDGHFVDPLVAVENGHGYGGGGGCAVSASLSGITLLLLPLLGLVRNSR